MLCPKKILNDGITYDIYLMRSFSQGCRLIQFLLDIITHPLLVILWKLAANVDIFGLYMPSRGQQVVEALVDNSFIFLQALVD